MVKANPQIGRLLSTPLYCELLLLLNPFHNIINSKLSLSTSFFPPITSSPTLTFLYTPLSFLLSKLQLFYKSLHHLTLPPSHLFPSLPPTMQSVFLSLSIFPHFLSFSPFLYSPPFTFFSPSLIPIIDPSPFYTFGHIKKFWVSF